MTDLLQLAERCETELGPDREIDAAIWLACVPGTTRKETRYIHGFSGKECVIDETRENHQLVIVPEYTASLDAAMTLLPDGFYFGAGNDGAGDGGPSGWAWVSSQDDFEIVRADTPALALCAAALRARPDAQTPSRIDGLERSDV